MALSGHIQGTRSRDLWPLVDTPQGTRSRDLWPLVNNQGACCNKHDGLSDRATDHRPLYLSIAEWSDAQSDSLSCLLKQAPAGSRVYVHIHLVSLVSHTINTWPYATTSNPLLCVAGNLGRSVGADIVIVVLSSR